MSRAVMAVEIIYSRTVHGLCLGSGDRALIYRTFTHF